MCYILLQKLQRKLQGSSSFLFKCWPGIFNHYMHVGAAQDVVL